MTAAVHTTELGKRYGATWALRDCSLTIPQGRVSALVGPNGAGKTTLLQLAVGVSRPTVGRVEVFGWSPHAQPLLVLARVGFVAQDHPLYRGFSVAEMLRVGRSLNPRWDARFATDRLDRLGIAPGHRVDKLSGGQRAQVALVLALAKRPELLLLDEPVAALDPLARREFLQSLMDAVAEGGLTVVLSSHLLADLERVCDHLVILSAARVQLAGEIDRIVADHRLLTGPIAAVERAAERYAVIGAQRTDRQARLLIAGTGSTPGAGARIDDPDLVAEPASVEEIVLAYLGHPGSREAVHTTQLEAVR